MTSHVFVGPHPDVLGSGQPLALDQIVEDVDLDDPHNQALVLKGWLVEHAAQKPSPARPRDQSTEEAE